LFFSAIQFRLDSEYPVRNMFKLFICAICQVELESGQGISIHEGLSKSGKLRPWDGPFLCHSCQEKKEAMEGKRHSRGTTLLQFHFMRLVSPKSHL
ncbi:Os04g0449400, partial [Oryza sativa Japonica Group]